MNQTEAHRLFWFKSIIVFLILLCLPAVSLSQQAARTYPAIGKPGYKSGDSPAINTAMRSGYNRLRSSFSTRKPTASPLRVASTYVVTTAADAGVGSFRRAIDSANTNPGLDVINFNIAGAGLKTISLLSALPTITGPVIIDGWTQPGFSGTPIIELRGDAAGTNINGLVLTGGNSTVRGLVINRFAGAAGGNGIGIALDENGGNIVEGNYIGTNPAGTAILPNTGPGIGIFGTSTGNRIGGTTAQSRNVISGNASGVIAVDALGEGGGNTIRGNYIGVNAAGTAVLGNTGNGIYLNTPNDTIGGIVAGSRNIISGNELPGVFIDGFASGTVVQGNYIGTNVTGAADLGNFQNGVFINGASNNVIGDPSSLGRNIISGNDYAGVYVYGASGNTIQGNYIGTNVAGSAALGNSNGIYIDNAPNNVIGGAAPGARNVISGNPFPGVYVTGGAATGNKIVNNFLGTNAVGAGPLGNGNGIEILGAVNNTIGGAAVGARNIISGNLFPGIFMGSLAFGNKVINNYIGTNAAGTSAVPNSAGIVIDAAPGNVIGGALTVEGNLVSGNSSYGVQIRNALATGNSIRSNFIGTDLTGTRGIGNSTDGVIINSSLDTVASNTIAYNLGCGVYDSSGTQNLIMGNSIFSNTGMGIDLAPRGLARNDSLDGDEGANGLQNFPLLDSATITGGDVTIHGRLNSKPSAQFRIEFYQNASYDPSHFGEGESPLSPPITVITNPIGNVKFDAAVPLGVFGGGNFITATATDNAGNTSEFSQALCLSDSDGDGIMDSWETAGWGIDVNSDSTIDLDLYALGARPNHKDIFVEIDAMSGMAPQATTLDPVVYSFATAPVNLVHNPDGTAGINLHYKLDETNILLNPWPANWWQNFDNVKQTHFGTPSERMDPNSQFILEAKKLVYRYCVFAYILGDVKHPSGNSENPGSLGGNDLTVALGPWSPSGGTEDDKAGTFMHELGHTLGLNHGGADNIKYKPNYISIMNYTWQFKYGWGQNFWALNYSPEALDSLNESNLDETIGLNPPASTSYPIIAVPFSGPSRDTLYARLAPMTPVDWNHNGVIDNAGTVAVDLNIFNPLEPTSPGQPLTSQTDWDKLLYNFRNSPAFFDLGRTSLLPDSTNDEMTLETFNFLNSLPPPKPGGQFVMDGQLDTSATLLASNAGINLYARYKSGQLYVATNSAQSQGGDMFIVVTDSLNALRSAPAGKTGQVAAWSVYLRNKSSDNSVAWYDNVETPLTNITVDTVGSVLEGVIDIELLFGKAPVNLYIAVGKYGPSAGGTLLAQVPVGNGDGNIDPSELFQVIGNPPPPPAYFTQQGNKLVGTGVGLSYSGQGFSVSVSGDGNTAIVGGVYDSLYVGAAWIFTRIGNVWTQQGHKLVGTGAVTNADQGCAVSISSDGNTALVGGEFDNASIGATWVFTRSGGGWTQQGPKLVGSGAAVGGAGQGTSVSVSADGNTAIVVGTGDGPWVFTRTGGVWTQQGPKLVAIGATRTGGSVDISSDGNAAIVGGSDNSGSGAVIFIRNGGVWTQQGPMLVGTGAVGAAEQGYSVAISGDGTTAIIGGRGDNNSVGAAWIFTRSSGVWTQQGSKLVGSGSVGTSRQGSSTSISSDGNTAIVGGRDDNGGEGAAWIYTRSGGVWSQRGDKLVGTGAANTPSTANQGCSVALSSDGTTAIVGGPRDNDAVGAAWVFTHDIQLPIQLASFTATVINTHNVRLDWTTISEANNYGFEVQRSRENDDYVTLPHSFIPGHGTTNEPHNYTFVDSTAYPAQWHYRLRQIDLDGVINFSDGISVNILADVSQQGLPDRFALSQNYPDPFNPSTTIQYQLPRTAHVKITMYNMLGQEVARLADGIETPGFKSVVWNAVNVASGVYLYCLHAGDFVQTRKLLLLK